MGDYLGFTKGEAEASASNLFKPVSQTGSSTGSASSPVFTKPQQTTAPSSSVSTPIGSQIIAPTGSLIVSLIDNPNLGNTTEPIPDETPNIGSGVQSGVSYAGGFGGGFSGGLYSEDEYTEDEAEVSNDVKAPTKQKVNGIILIAIIAGLIYFFSKPVKK